MKDKGFTLIELVIVIIVVAVLAAVAVPRFWDLITPSKIKLTRHRMEEIKKAIVGSPEMTGAGTYSARGFRGDVGSFPNSFTDLVSQGSYPNWDRYTKKGWNGPYVDETGGQYLIDAWGNNFVYSSSGTPNITSYGQDGASGGGDDIVVELRY